MKTLSLPLAIIGSMLIAVMSAGIAWGLNKERLDEVTRNVEALKTNKEENADRIRTIEVKIDFIREALERIEKNTKK